MPAEKNAEYWRNRRARVAADKTAEVTGAAEKQRLAAIERAKEKEPWGEFNPDPIAEEQYRATMRRNEQLREAPEDVRREYNRRVDAWLSGNNTHKDRRDKKD